MSQNTDQPSNSELIDRSLSGDGDAYAMIVERFQRRIYRVAFAIVRDDVEADGITQDTFVKAYLSLGKFQGRAELETWLTRITINLSRDFLRRRRFVSLITPGSDDEREMIFEAVDERPGPERQMMAVQLRAAIRNAEKALSAQQKVIFRLRHYENLSLEDIAGHLGLRPGTVRAHLFRAIHKIRQELSGWRNGSTRNKIPEA
ncbi:MAG: sigma-70 family RNA polymerase sigma factor [Acidobacteriota bacterium]